MCEKCDHQTGFFGSQRHPRTKAVVAGGFLLVAVVLAGCASGSGGSGLETYQPSFDYSPPERAETAEAGVSMLLVAPQYVSDQRGSWAREMWPNLTADLQGDMEELLTGRGYTLEGPFQSRDELVYSAKKNSDLIVTPEIDITVDFINLSWKENQSVLGALADSDPTYSIEEGTAQVSSRLNLIISESMTGEKLWTKSLEVLDQRVTFTGHQEYPSRPPSNAQVNMNNIGKVEIDLQNKVAQALENAYTEVLQTVWDHLDPREMRGIKKQADEIKANTTFESQ